MAQLLVRDLDPALVARLKEQATRHQRSLEAEVRVILAEAVPDRAAFHEAVRFAAEMRSKYAGKITDDSTDIIREARDSR